MRAAIYARKSTAQAVADDGKSVTRQVENARQFAASRGWTVVADEHVYIDDGISGAETSRLRERARMLQAAAHREFDVVVMQSPDRFSRSEDGHHELKQLARLVQVWFYADGSKFETGTLAANTIGFLKSEFAAEYRRSVAAKTTEAMRRRAALGHATGNRVFGYDNVRRSGYVERVVHTDEANVVRRVFAEYAAGRGFKQIAHGLNADKLPSPRAQRGRPSGWDPGTIRAILRRPIYRGLIVYGKTKKRDTDGARHKGRQPKTPRDQWIEIDAPHLKLIDDRTLALVDKRLADRRHAYLRDTKGHLLGSPKRHGHQPRHLLSGYLTCACGGSYVVENGRYRCAVHRRKGSDVCPSLLSFDARAVETVFLDVLEDVLLNPSFVDHVVDAACSHDGEAERAALLEERDRLTTEIANLTKGIAHGGDIPTLAQALKERDDRLRKVQAELARPLVSTDGDALRAALTQRAVDWRDILRGPHLQQARLVLQNLVDLPIRVVQMVPDLEIKDTPGLLWGDPRAYQWVTAAKPEGLTVGMRVSSVASPTGFEPVFWP